MKLNFKKTAFATGVMAIAITTMSVATPSSKKHLGKSNEREQLVVATINNLEEAGWKESVLRTAGEFLLHAAAYVATHYLIGGAEETRVALQENNYSAEKNFKARLADL